MKPLSFFVLKKLLTSRVVPLLHYFCIFGGISSDTKPNDEAGLTKPNDEASCKTEEKWKSSIRS